MFDESLPWKKLPHFIQEKIYWRPMVYARNEMGWKALHEQLFPFKYGKQHCWDCKCELHQLNGYNLLETVFDRFDTYISGDEFLCEKCGLRGKRKRFCVSHDHEGMFPRTDLPFYKVHVFGYLVNNLYRPRFVTHIGHPLLTGYHISHGVIGAKILTRYYDEDNDYTCRYHIFRPVFLWHELVATFA